MTPIAETRGFRNHNPGNIRHGEKWIGLAPEQPDPAFCRFVSPEYGIRAMGRILLSYQRRHGLNTIRGIIGRWAPASENNTAAYILHICHRMDTGPDAAIDVGDLATLQRLVTAIIIHECGENPYTDDLIRHGLAMALEG